MALVLVLAIACAIGVGWLGHMLFDSWLGSDRRSD